MRERGERERERERSEREMERNFLEKAASHLF